MERKWKLLFTVFVQGGAGKLVHAHVEACDTCDFNYSLLKVIPYCSSAIPQNPPVIRRIFILGWSGGPSK